MADAFIYDHVRTPRGRGKVDGALHEVTALTLAMQALAAVKDRNDLDPTLVDDVVLGCVDPIGEAGGEMAHICKLVAYLTDVRHREPVYRTMGTYIRGVHPVCTGLVVVALARPTWLVEIDATAVIPDP